MQGSSRRLSRVLRALIACLVLLFAVEAPAAAFAVGTTRDVSAWVSSRGAAVPASAERRSPLAQPAACPARAVPSRAEQPAPRRALPSGALTRARRDGRYLYLEHQSLLC